MPGVLDTRQPSIRTADAYAGAWLALFAGVAGVVAAGLYWVPSAPFAMLPEACAYLITVIVAIVVLMRIGRLRAAALLQGMWWPATAYVAQDIVSSSVDHMLGNTGHQLAGYWVMIGSDACGAAAAVFLVIAWRPAAERRLTRQIRPLGWALLFGMGVSQAVILLAVVTSGGANDPYYAAWYTIGIAEILVGMTVAWRAVTLRSSAQGGALVAGWAIVTTLVFAPTWGSPSNAANLGLVLEACLALLALIYMRQRRRLAPEGGMKRRCAECGLETASPAAVCPRCAAPTA